jgi:SET domain-containing protein
MPLVLAAMENIAVVGNGLEVRTSTIKEAGLGLFATRPFKSNDYITQYCGRRTSADEAKAAVGPGQEFGRHHSHTKSVGPHEVILGLQGHDARTGIGGASLANHAKTPNTTYASLELKSGQTLIFIKAKTDIKPGDELFVNYGRNYWLRLGKAETQ